MLRLEFEFSQESRRVYFDDQSALFVKAMVGDGSPLTTQCSGCICVCWEHCS
jgi:hypothetical protein